MSLKRKRRPDSFLRTVRAQTAVPLCSSTWRPVWFAWDGPCSATICRSGKGESSARHRPLGPRADQDGLRAAAQEVRSRVNEPVFLGGHSYGGRQASIVAAEQVGAVPGILLLSYPLHPPGKPEQLRTAHFKNIEAPCLFIHGTSDPFGSPDEIKTAISLIPGKCKLILLDGLGHDLGKGKPEVVSRIAEEFNKFVSA